MYPHGEHTELAGSDHETSDPLTHIRPQTVLTTASKSPVQRSVGKPASGTSRRQATRRVVEVDGRGLPRPACPPACERNPLVA